MKVHLLKDARIRHKAGEVVEVTKDEAEFLLSVEAAVVVEEQPKEQPKEQPTQKRKTGKK